MITAIAASAVMVALLLLARPGFIVSPQSVDAPAPDSTREEDLVRQINQLNEEFSPEFWRRYRELRAKLAAATLVVHLAINGRVTDSLIKILCSLPGCRVPWPWRRLPAGRSAAGG